MSDPKASDGPATPKQRSEYVAGGQNPISPARPDGPAGPRDDSQADTQAGPASRSRVQMSRPLQSWIYGLIGILALLLILVLLWATGGLRGGQAQVPSREPILLGTATAEAGQSVLGGAELNMGEAPTVGPPPAVGGRFQSFYESRGGLRILGAPLSEVLTVNGREIQWFERARVEHWPEYAGTPYETQLGRVGVEYTAGRSFAPQTFFVSRPDLRYFGETGHALGGAFLTYWEQNGGLDVFGLPISEEFTEVMPDGKPYLVQYFERARLELHPEAGGTPYEVQSGLLGTVLYRNESRPATIQLLPTAVPLP